MKARHLLLVLPLALAAWMVWGGAAGVGGGAGSVPGSGSGGGAATTNASDLTTGTLADARLSTWLQSISNSLPVYYVDSVNGSDANHGRTPQAAWQTIARLSNTLNSVEIRLARGSHWREQLTLGTNCTVDAYGSGPRPILDASEVATNSAWSKESTATSVWKQDWTFTDSGYASVVEEGIQLYRTNTLANCDSAPGSFYLDSLDVGAASTHTIYIHPRGSTAPTNDAKVYEINKRNFGLFGGNYSTVRSVHTRNNISNDGSLEVGHYSLVEDVMCENGTKHNFLIGSGVVRDSKFVKQEYSLQNATLFVAYATVPSAEAIIERCYAMALPGAYGQSASGYFSHAGDGAFKYLRFVDCIAEYTGFSSSISTNGLIEYDNCKAIHGTFSLIGNGSTNVMVNCEATTSPAIAVSPSATGVGITKIGGQVFLSGLKVSGFPYPVRIDYSTNTTVTLLDSILTTTYLAGISTVEGSNVVCIISNSALPGFNLTGGNTISGADSNVYSSAVALTVDGTAYTSLVDYVAAESLDQNSTTNDMRYLSDTRHGDFRFASTSPGVTNRVGPGWSTPRIPFYLQGNAYEEPPRLVGGEWPEDRYLSLLTLYAPLIVTNRSIADQNDSYIYGGTVAGTNGAQFWKFADGAGQLSGILQVSDGSQANPAIQMGDSQKIGIWKPGSYKFGIGSAAGMGWQVDFGTGDVMIGSAYKLGWSSTGSADGTPVLYLAKDGQDALGQRRGANAQVFRVYGAHTDDSNYQRLALTGGSTTMNVSAETAGAGEDNINLVLTPAGTGSVVMSGPAYTTGTFAGNLAGGSNAINPSASGGIEITWDGYNLAISGTNAAGGTATNIFLGTSSSYLNILTNGDGNWTLSVDFDPQPASANLTNWSAIATTSKQDAHAALTNVTTGASNRYVGTLSGPSTGLTNQGAADGVRAVMTTDGIDFNDTSGTQLQYIWRAATTGGSQDSYFYNPDATMQWLGFYSHPQNSVDLLDRSITFWRDISLGTNYVGMTNTSLYVDQEIVSGKVTASNVLRTNVAGQFESLETLSGGTLNVFDKILVEKSTGDTLGYTLLGTLKSLIVPSTIGDLESYMSGVNILTAPEVDTSAELAGILTDELGNAGKIVLADVTSHTAGDTIVWDGSKFTNAPFGSAVTVAAGTNGIAVTSSGGNYTVHDTGVKSYLSVTGQMDVATMYVTNFTALSGISSTKDNKAQPTIIMLMNTNTASISWTNTTAVNQIYYISGGTNVLVGVNELLTVFSWPSYIGNATVLLQPNEWLVLDYDSNPQVVRKAF